MGKSWTKPEVLTNLHDVGHPEVAIDGRVQEVVRRMSFKSAELLADLEETEQKLWRQFHLKQELIELLSVKTC